MCAGCDADRITRKEAAVEGACLQAAAPPEPADDQDQDPGKPRRGRFRWRP